MVRALCCPHLHPCCRGHHSWFVDDPDTTGNVTVDAFIVVFWEKNRSYAWLKLTSVVDFVVLYWPALYNGSTLLFFVFFLSLQCKNVRKKPSTKEIFVISTLRKNLHSQNCLFVCFNRDAVRHRALADCTFAFLYLDACLLLANGTYSCLFTTGMVSDVLRCSI